MKRLIVVALILACAISANALERVEKKAHFYPAVGVSIPTGSLGDLWNMGFHGQFGVGIEAGPQIEIVPTLAYHSFALDKQGLPITGGTIHALMIGGDFKYSFTAPGQRTIPFVIAGFGIGSVGVSDLSGPGGTASVEGETKAYLNFGAGIDIISSSRSAVSISARYVSVMTSGEALTFVPFTIGLRF